MRLAGPTVKVNQTASAGTKGSAALRLAATTLAPKHPSMNQNGKARPNITESRELPLNASKVATST